MCSFSLTFQKYSPLPSSVFDIICDQAFLCLCISFVTKRKTQKMDKDTASDKTCVTFTLRQPIAQQNFITYSHRESYGQHKIDVNRTIGSNFVCRDMNL